LNGKINIKQNPMLYNYLSSKEFCETKNLFVFFILEKNLLDNAYFSVFKQKHNFSDSKVKLNKIEIQNQKFKKIKNIVEGTLILFLYFFILTLR
jgi:hypothetical protein